jgi:hypothetical protein
MRGNLIGHPAAQKPHMTNLRRPWTATLKKADADLLLMKDLAGRAAGI